MGLFSTEIYLHKRFLGKVFLEVKKGKFFSERSVGSGTLTNDLNGKV